SSFFSSFCPAAIPAASRPPRRPKHTAVANRAPGRAVILFISFFLRLVSQDCGIGLYARLGGRALHTLSLDLTQGPRECFRRLNGHRHPVEGGPDAVRQRRE